MFEFERALPEEVGIPSLSIRKTLEFLDQKEVPMHSLLIMRRDKLIFEKYYKPYEKDTLHRMFSISKTFTALAISLLMDEEKIHYEDKIVSFFPEYVSEDTHPWIKEMTIRNLLEMRTCHASTTYKVDMKSNWVESFFTVKPTHKPGTVFHYDTSAAHTLCALVEKLSGTDLLSFLKEKILKYVDFSDDSYMVKDPFGVSIGGSGLMATPMDILKVLYILDKNGEIICNDGIKRLLLNPDFIKLATSSISDSIMSAPVPSEAQGYGMQIWQNEKGGFVLYGMGGQLAISIPSEELLIVTCADTQGMAGGNQVIYNAIYDILLPALDTAWDSKYDYDKLLKYTQHFKIAPPRLPEGRRMGGANIDIAPKKPLLAKYKLIDNPQGFDELILNLENPTNCTLKFTGNNVNLSFAIGDMKEGIFPIYDVPYTAGAIWLRENVLYIRFHLVGECVGSVRMELYLGEKDIVVYMRKIEETYFKEFDGHLYGTIIK